MSKIQAKRQYELSDKMYKVLYENDKPKYRLSTRDFMELLFVMDELSMNPLFARELKGEDQNG